MFLATPSRVRWSWRRAFLQPRCCSRGSINFSSSITTSTIPPDDTPTKKYLSATLSPTPDPKEKFDTCRKLLVLDLNGVLLLRSPIGKGKRIVWPRPYMQPFRQYLFHPNTTEWLDTMVWSSAQPSNVKNMVQETFKDTQMRLLKVWARDMMGLNANAYNQKSRTVKDLQKVWTMLAQEKCFKHSLYTTLLMDDSFDKARLQPYNHIVVPEYDTALRTHDVKALRAKERGEKDAQHDDILICAVGILEAIKKQDNVAHWVRNGGLRLGRDVGEVKEEAASWWVDKKVREHWKESGMAVLDEMKIVLNPGVWP